MDSEVDKSGSDGAAGSLRAAEQVAGSDTVAQADGGVAGANAIETGGFYRGAGRQTGGGDKKKKAKGFLKGKGPMGLILGLILGVGGVMGGAQVFQPFSLVEQFRETFNSMQTSVSTRSNSMLKFQLGEVKYPTRVNFLGKQKFSLSKKQQSKLSQNGIEFDEDMKALVYVDENGKKIIVAADDSAATRIKNNFDIDTETTDVTTFKNVYESDYDFFKKYNSSSLTWRGAIANWFGTLTLEFLVENKLTRNLFVNYRQEMEESGASPKTVMTDMIAKGTDEIEDGGRKTVEFDSESDEDGNQRITGISDGPGETPSGRTISRSGLTVDKVKAEIDEVRQKYAKGDGGGGGITGIAQGAANYTCLVFNFLGGIGLLVSASEALQIIHLVTAYFEAIDKVKAGDGDDSPINEIATSLNSNTKNINEVLELSGTANNSLNTINNGGDDNTIKQANDDLAKSFTTKSVSTEKTAMESSGIAALYGGGRVNPNDASVQSFNFTNSIKTIMGGIGLSMSSFVGCSLAKLATNAASAIETTWTTVSCVTGASAAGATFGVSLLGCLPALFEIASGIALSVGASLLIAGVIAAITPVVANMMTRDLISTLGGEDLGNALTSGANMYLGNTHRFNGGSLATSKKYTEFAVARQQVIAENAKYERMVRDPLDATSKYTFLGTLMTQMMSFMTVNSLTSAVRSAGTVVSSSIAAISPTAVAYEIKSDLPTPEEYEVTCPYLASIGAVGDAYCNPYAVTDMSTISVDPSVVIEDLAKEGNFLNETTASGNVKIKEDSDLAKYIVFCDNRNSAFGIADQNIVNQVTNFATVNINAVDSAIGAIPIIGDSIDVINNGKALANAGYVSGESCVAGNDVTYGVSWSKASTYQRFIEDQSLMESMGMFGDDGESAVTAFLREYYEEHPLDNSYEGILARYSGLSKEDVIAFLDIIDYGNYIANYDAATRYAFGAPAVEVENEILFDNENAIANVYVVLLNEISFADIRNRTTLI